MSRSRPLHIATFALFVGVLVAPWLAGLFGASSDTVERRAPAPRPELSVGALGDASTFADVNAFVRDRTPLRGNATAWINKAWLTVDASGDQAVVEGPDGFFFLSEDFTRPCERGYELDDMAASFVELREAAASGGKEFYFLVAPDKGAVLDYRLTDRAAQAAACSRVARPEFRAAIEATGVSFDLAPALVESDKADPNRWYYEHDSHWTFAGGSVAAEQIVNTLRPDLYVRSDVRALDRSLPINGDIFRRLGITRTLEVPDAVLASVRPNTTTDRSEEQIDGTRTVRTYRNTGTDELIEGRTIAVHDSMMNFAERQLASYFEEIVFIHREDLTKAGFFAELRASDRLIMLTVERNVHPVVRSEILDDDFSTKLANALKAERVEG